MADEKIRVLSIDGGGIRGVIPSVFLLKIEEIIKEKHNKSLTDYFDFVAGTSTGSIIAAGVATGISMKKMNDLYFLRGREIFPYRSRWSLKRIGLIFRHGLSAPKYSAESLREVLKQELGDRTVGGIKKIKLLIPFYDTITRSAQFIKSYSASPGSALKFGDVPVWEAALCSSSAPTFFPAHNLKVNGRSYSAIDGGVAANNPMACAFADAVKLSGGNGDIRILSLGTGSNSRKISFGDAQEWGALEWAIPIISVLMDATLDVYRYITQEMIGKDNLLRLQFELSGKKWGVERLNDDMDDASSDNLHALKSASERYLSGVENALYDFL